MRSSPSGLSGSGGAERGDTSAGLEVIADTDPSVAGDDGVDAVRDERVLVVIGVEVAVAACWDSSVVLGHARCVVVEAIVNGFEVVFVAGRVGFEKGLVGAEERVVDVEEVAIVVNSFDDIPGSGCFLSKVKVFRFCCWPVGNVLGLDEGGRVRSRKRSMAYIMEGGHLTML